MTDVVQERLRPVNGGMHIQPTVQRVKRKIGYDEDETRPTKKQVGTSMDVPMMQS
jgi:hypothetical protein